MQNWSIFLNGKSILYLNLQTSFFRWSSESLIEEAFVFWDVLGLIEVIGLNGWRRYGSSVEVDGFWSATNDDGSLGMLRFDDPCWSSEEASAWPVLSKERRSSSSLLGVWLAWGVSVGFISIPITDSVGADGVELASKTGSRMFSGEARFSFSLQIAAIGCSL